MGCPHIKHYRYKKEKAVRSQKLRNFLCLFHILLCVMVFNQQSFAGTWADAFEDDNTHGWKIINNINNSAKWWIDAGEAVCETFAPNIPSERIVKSVIKPKANRLLLELYFIIGGKNFLSMHSKSFTPVLPQGEN